MDHIPESNNIGRDLYETIRVNPTGIQTSQAQGARQSGPPWWRRELWGSLARSVDAQGFNKLLRLLFRISLLLLSFVGILSDGFN